MNVLEFHTWNATVRNIGKPDRMVFDLDPGDGVAWKRSRKAALLVRSLLQELALESWLKTSGGKGLHVVVPLMPRDDWDSVKELSQCARTTPCSCDPRPLRRDERANATGSAGSSSTSCATATARPPPRRSRCARDAGSGCRCRCPGRPRLAEKRRPLDGGHGARTPVVPDPRPLGRLLEVEADDRRAPASCWRGPRPAGIRSARAPGTFPCAIAGSCCPSRPSAPPRSGREVLDGSTFDRIADAELRPGQHSGEAVHRHRDRPRPCASTCSPRTARA